MADPRFFNNAGPYTLADIAAGCKAVLASDDKGAVTVKDLAALHLAGEGELTFLENKKYRDQAATTKAAACFVKESEAAFLPDGCVALICAYPYWSYALAAHMFYPQDKQPEQHSDGPREIDPTAKIHPTAVIGANVKIGANCVVEALATVGQGTIMGEGCVIMTGASVSHAIFGNNVKIFPGARIGQPGFGYAIDSKTGNHLYLPQMGRVILEDNVEIGANTTIDRGAGPDTKVGFGTKIDNLCQIAHNVEIGRGCFLAGHVGISGSTKVGNGVMMGGQAGLAGHLTIGDGAMILAKSGLMRDVANGESIMGAPGLPAKEFMKREAWLRKNVSRRGNNAIPKEDDNG